MTVLSLTWESPYPGKTVFILKQGPAVVHVGSQLCLLEQKAEMSHTGLLADNVTESTMSQSYTGDDEQ